MKLGRMVLRWHVRDIPVSKYSLLFKREEERMNQLLENMWKEKKSLDSLPDEELKDLTLFLIRKNSRGDEPLDLYQQALSEIQQTGRISDILMTNLSFNNHFYPIFLQISRIFENSDPSLAIRILMDLINDTPRAPTMRLKLLKVISKVIVSRFAPDARHLLHIQINDYFIPSNVFDAFKASPEHMLHYFSTISYIIVMNRIHNPQFLEDIDKILSYIFDSESKLRLNLKTIELSSRLLTISFMPTSFESSIAYWAENLHDSQLHQLPLMMSRAEVIHSYNSKKLVKKTKFLSSFELGSNVKNLIPEEVKVKIFKRLLEAPESMTIRSKDSKVLDYFYSDCPEYLQFRKKTVLVKDYRGPDPSPDELDHFFEQLIKNTNRYLIKREVYMYDCQVDFMLRDKTSDRKIVVELNGPFHYFSANQLSGISLLQIFRRIKLFNCQIVHINKRFFEVINTLGKSEELIDELKDHTEGNFIELNQDFLDD